MIEGTFFKRFYKLRFLARNIPKQDKVSNILSFLCLLILLDSSGDAT